MNLLLLEEKWKYAESYINNYDGRAVYVATPSGLVGAKFERETEPTPEEIKQLKWRITTIKTKTNRRKQRCTITPMEVTTPPITVTNLDV